MNKETDDNDLIKQAYDLVEGVKLSLLLTGNLPEIIKSDRVSLLEKQE